MFYYPGFTGLLSTFDFPNLNRIQINMNFQTIIDRLNQLAKTTRNLKDLPNIRVENKGLSRPGAYTLFSTKSTFPDDSYAFHSGGRSEIQFNVGVEYLDEREIFRYGLGFSLGPNQTQPDPIIAMTPRIKAFNAWLRDHPGEFADLNLWHYNDQPVRVRSQDYPMMEIPDNWIAWNNFIFFGRYVNTPEAEIEEADLLQIIQLLDRLMPVYIYVESNYSNFVLPTDGDRMARLCWNANGWVRPSGAEGKSTHESTHEAQFGYGHEEWLGDLSKTIDGYHYAFVEAFRNLEKEYGKVHNIEFYTVDGIRKKRFMVGRVANAEVIAPVLADRITKEYKKNGWYQQMEAEVRAVGANSKGFSNWHGVDLFNVRFKPADLYFYPDYLETDDPSITEPKHYTLLYKKAPVQTVIPVNGAFAFTPDTDEPDDEPSADEVETNTYDHTPGPIEISYLHKKIRDTLKKYLIHLYGCCINKESPTGQGTQIDLVREENSRYIFYEIKTYNSLRLCIREALGQLLEYSHWPGSDNAHELIIVSHNRITDEARQYLDHLRKTYKIRLYYQQFVWEDQFLSEKY